MSIIDTLITNRTQADVDALQALYSKPKSMWTTDEWNEFLLGNHRGAYNATDMNRVLDALDYLADRVTEFGYRKPIIKRPSIAEIVPGTSRLPQGYTELEYIQSTGEQFVDTRFMPNQDTRVVMDAQMLSATASTFYFGTRKHVSGVASENFNVLYTASGVRSDYGDSKIASANENVTNRLLIDKNKNVCTVGNTTITNGKSTFQSSHSLYLAASNDDGIAKFFCSERIYSCQIYDNATLVRDYVPCLNHSNEVGLYDIENGVFYGNAGTGAFLAGGVLDTEIITTVRDHYKIGDRPPVAELAQYLHNVARIRGVLELPGSVPVVPEDISQRITIEGANNIEIILTAVEALLNRIALSWLYAGEIYSGEV